MLKLLQGLLAARLTARLVFLAPIVETLQASVASTTSATTATTTPGGHSSHHRGVLFLWLIKGGNQAGLPAMKGQHLGLQVSDILVISFPQHDAKLS